MLAAIQESQLVLKEECRALNSGGTYEIACQSESRFVCSGGGHDGFVGFVDFVGFIDSGPRAAERRRDGCD
jgi:hypothetical protein